MNLKLYSVAYAQQATVRQKPCGENNGRGVQGDESHESELLHKTSSGGGAQPSRVTWRKSRFDQSDAMARAKGGVDNQSGMLLPQASHGCSCPFAHLLQCSSCSEPAPWSNLSPGDDRLELQPAPPTLSLRIFQFHAITALKPASTMPKESTLANCTCVAGKMSSTLFCFATLTSQLACLVSQPSSQPATGLHRALAVSDSRHQASITPSLWHLSSSREEIKSEPSGATIPLPGPAHECPSEIDSIRSQRTGVSIRACVAAILAAHTASWPPRSCP